eukprot:TRINITY_DN22198_c0_g1_i1.p1 TRINITY_DN22198_c0_g1~~TRINITY_DN22198_c0_g1_i1.p1  ORF type:complete len:159 (+),score=25.81 TRINITY_DN22198_c0_g1_i1:81-557(+)
MSSMDELQALAGAAAACAMALTALLSLLDMGFSMSVLHGLCQSFALLVGGFICLQGETRLFYTYSEAIRENFGFALKPLGRSSAYFLAGLYCIGARGELVAEQELEHKGPSSAFGFLWYICCLLMLLGGVASLWVWRSERRTALFAPQGDIDGYYIST